MTPLRLVICGAKGRMGRTLMACAANDPELRVAGAVDLGDDLAGPIAGCDVVIEFALPDATARTAELAAARRKPLVIGTTGHSDAERERIRGMLSPIPVVWASNFSAGVNTLFWLTGQAAKVVGADWSVEIVETHHTAKKDAPSGTAKTLQEIIRQARGAEPPAHALRIGDVVGDHTVVFGAAGERLELTHRAGSRESFARGALRAARWVVKQPPGLYDMRDVLGLR
jgi:4-hydroxy-tetrahydrodipicolinate reductase